MIKLIYLKIIFEINISSNNIFDIGISKLYLYKLIKLNNLNLEFYKNNYFELIKIFYYWNENIFIIIKLVILEVNIYNYIYIN